MHAGFADLNLPHGPDVDSQTQRERLALALRLGAPAERTLLDAALCES